MAFGTPEVQDFVYKIQIAHYPAELGMSDGDAEIIVHPQYPNHDDNFQELLDILDTALTGDEENGGWVIISANRPLVQPVTPTP